MAEPIEATVQLIDEYAWKRAEVLPVDDPVCVSERLAKFALLGMALGVLPSRRIPGDPYNGVASELGRCERLKADADSTKPALVMVRRRPARSALPPSAPGTGGVHRSA